MHSQVCTLLEGVVFRGGIFIGGVLRGSANTVEPPLSLLQEGCFYRGCFYRGRASRDSRAIRVTKATSIVFIVTTKVI